MLNGYARVSAQLQDIESQVQRLKSAGVTKIFFQHHERKTL